MKLLHHIQLIDRYQQCDWVHHLTCGEDSTHPKLIPRVGPNGICELYCPAQACSFRQPVTVDMLLRVGGLLKQGDPKKRLQLA